MYSAWAKVRKKKYFYGSTRLDGDTFDYFANPKSILKGRIAAFVLFVLYAVAAELYPPARYGFWAIAVLAFPWLIARAFAFNARNSAYRGLRFDFSATTDQAAKLYLGKFAIVVLTLGFALPWFIARQKAFLVSHHAFGTTRFGCELSARKFFGIYLRAGLIVFVGGALIGVLSWTVPPMSALPEALDWLTWFLPAAAMYAAYAIAYAYVQARTTNLMWTNTYGPGVQFESSLEAWRLVKLYLGNVVAVACTAGLLIPWAVVRSLRYRLENFKMTVDSDVVPTANPALAPVGATGQELGDLFNVDLGIGAFCRAIISTVRPRCGTRSMSFSLKGGSGSRVRPSKPSSTPGPYACRRASARRRAGCICPMAALASSTTATLSTA